MQKIDHLQTIWDEQTLETLQWLHTACKEKEEKPKIGIHNLILKCKFYLNDKLTD